MEPKLFNVNENARIWAGHSDAHRMGWLYAPAAILAVEEYEGSYRFEEWRVVGAGYADLTERTSGYPQWWIRVADVSLLPYEDPTDDPEPEPEPDPDPEGEGPSNEELGAAVRVFFSAFWAELQARG